MKRKIAWLALPLVLCALMLGVKWRAEHPTPTKEDLAVRVLMLRSPKIHLTYHTPRVEDSFSYFPSLPKAEFQPLVDSFHLSPKSTPKPYSSRKGELIVEFSPEGGSGSPSVIVEVDVYENQGTVRVRPPIAGSETRILHRVTARRWIELLLNHPRIGPKLRKRMHQ